MVVEWWGAPEVSKKQILIVSPILTVRVCRFQRQRSNNMRTSVVLYLLFQCALLPLISGKTASGGNSMEATKDAEGNFLSKSNSLRDSIPNTGVKGNDGEDEIVENWKLDPSQATPTKLFTAYKETYITKAAAKKFLQKIRSLKKPFTDKEYDDLLQEIMLVPKPTSKYSIYDKKYFDYLPSDQSEGKVEVAKVDQEVTEKPHHPHHHHSRHHHKRERSKRHANTDEEKRVAKRQTEAEWTRHFLEHERMYNEHLRREHDEERNRRYSQQYQPVVYANHLYSPPVTGVYNNPWNNPHYRPQLNNQYLPPTSPSQFIVRPEQNYINYPIPGVNYNVPYPPQNPPPAQAMKPEPASQPEEVPAIVTDTRFGEEDEVDKPPVWDVQEKPSRFIPQRPNQPSPVATTTRRPPSSPSIIRDNEDYYDDLSSSNRIPQNSVSQSTNPTTRRPLPVIRNEEDYDDILSGGTGNIQRFPSQSNQLGSGSTSVQQRPNQQPERRPTPPPPPSPSTRAPQADGPSRCVWAIVNCCSPRNPAVRYACFERVGCNGVFWDLNPCSDVVVQAAIDETNRYFN
ncbi:hypothetical protein DMENIID0001_016030 [Sergentomyia squamirostris]